MLTTSQIVARIERATVDIGGDAGRSVRALDALEGLIIDIETEARRDRERRADPPVEAQP